MSNTSYKCNQCNTVFEVYEKDEYSVFPDLIMCYNCRSRDVFRIWKIDSEDTKRK